MVHICISISTLYKIVLTIVLGVSHNTIRRDQVMIKCTNSNGNVEQNVHRIHLDCEMMVRCAHTNTYKENVNGDKFIGAKVYERRHRPRCH